ncbi:MAG TPA: GAF domain-containing protein, partial [Chloroflexota bacterium]|nr:GAF domain-containing protein [Chloroflexota bacterium]
MPKKRIRDSATAPDRTLGRARRLIAMMTALAATRIVDDLVRVIVEGAAELLDAETSSLMLLDEETNELIVVAATAASGEEAMRYRIPPGRGIAGWVVEHGKAIVSNCPRSDPRFFGTI